MKFSYRLPLLAAPITMAAALLLTSNAVAQGPCLTPNIGATIQSPPAPQMGLTEVWVDPINGNDGTGTVNDGTLPFATIASARTALLGSLTASGGASAANRGLIHLGAGIYSQTTNGETFPLMMADWVDVQGVGAKQTVLRGTTDTPVNTFLPLGQSFCDCGDRVASTVLVDFSEAIQPSYDEMIDSVTFQGADIQVYAEAGSAPLDGRVSNSIFDLLHNPGQGYDGAQFGILMVHAYQGPGKGKPKGHGEPSDGDTFNSYEDVRLNVFNNTFIQSWDPTGMPLNGQPQFSALDESVAICDVTDPDCDGELPDTNTTLRGVGNPNIQSNLIRAFDTTPPISLMGIDSADVNCAVGTRLGATNAFDPNAVAGLSPFATTSGLFYCSNIVGALPVPATDAGGADLNPNGFTTGQDPAFVGEAVSTQIPGLTSLGHSRDWRLISSSPYIDQGSQPVNGAFMAVNGTVHTDIPCSPQSSFDMDGEYWGNPRVAANPLLALGSAAVIDIGYDEASVLIDHGTANDSVVHAPSAVPAYGPFVGQSFRIFIYPSSGPTAQDFAGIVAMNTPLSILPNGFTAYSHFPAALTVPVVIPGTLFGAPFNVLWLDQSAGLGQSFTYVPLRQIAPNSYISPFDGSIRSFGFDAATSSMTTTGAPAYFTEQAIYLPATGPNAGSILLSNLQGLHD